MNEALSQFYEEDLLGADEELHCMTVGWKEFIASEPADPSPGLAISMRIRQKERWVAQLDDSQALGLLSAVLDELDGKQITDPALTSLRLKGEEVKNELAKFDTGESDPGFRDSVRTAVESAQSAQALLKEWQDKRKAVEALHRARVAKRQQERQRREAHDRSVADACARLYATGPALVAFVLLGGGAWWGFDSWWLRTAGLLVGGLTATFVSFIGAYSEAGELQGVAVSMLKEKWERDDRLVGAISFREAVQNSYALPDDRLATILRRTRLAFLACLWLVAISAVLAGAPTSISWFNVVWLAMLALAVLSAGTWGVLRAFLAFGRVWLSHQ